MHYSVFAQPHPEQNEPELQAKYETKSSVWLLCSQLWRSAHVRFGYRSARLYFLHLEAKDDFCRFIQKNITWLPINVRSPHTPVSSKAAPGPTVPHPHRHCYRQKLWRSTWDTRSSARVFWRTTLGEDSFKEICLMLGNTEPQALGFFFSPFFAG